MSASPRPSTRQRILAAAEQLFAERGFAAASLRQVTAAAKVNLAAVNYHFGSKDNLIEEVFRWRLDELSRRRLARLTEVSASDEVTLEGLLEAFIAPALELSGDRKHGAVFMRILARAFAEHDDKLRGFLSNDYDHVLVEFATALARVLPGLDERDLRWRFNIAVGALRYAMADYRRPTPHAGSAGDRRRLAERLIHFTAAGLRA